MTPRPSPSNPGESAQSNEMEGVETGRASLDSSDRSSNSGHSQRIDTTTFHSGTVAQHYSTHLGGSQPATATATRTPASEGGNWATTRSRSWGSTASSVGGGDVFNLTRHYQSAALPARPEKAAPFTTKGFFAQTEQYHVDQSVNFMDHNRANYTPPAPKRGPPETTSSSASSRGKRTSFVDIFLSRTSSSASSRGKRTSFVDIFLSRRGDSSSTRGGSGSATRSAGGASPNQHNTIDEEDDEDPLWRRSAGWLMVALSFGIGATFLALSVPHLARHSLDARAQAMKAAERKRWNECKAAILATGLTEESVLVSKNNSQYYALRWLTVADPAGIGADDPEFPNRYALAVFFYSNHPEIADAHSRGERRDLHETKWNHDDRWMSRSSVCHWYGIECGKTLNDENDILSWNMTGNRLEGSIPSEIAGLSHLELLDFSANGLEGELPIQIYEMQYLKKLCLRNCGFSGTISDEIGFFYPIEELDLSENLLVGTLPSSMKKMVNLRELNLRNNQLSGWLPDISALLELVALDFDQNKFTGRFPTGLTQLTKLTRISLEDNQLSGSLPGLLAEFTDLEMLRLGHNLLTGAIPDVFQYNRKMIEIRLQKNQLQQTLPASLGNLTNLKSIMMDSNKLIGSIPDQWMSISALESLILQNNDLTGTLSPNIGQLTNMQDLWLNQNHIRGVIPADVARLTDLVTLHLDNNEIEGLLPKELGTMQSLQALRLSGTKLTGAVPEEVCTLKKTSELVFISASCNKLRCMCCDKCS